jgi:transcriptional antiterminator RfaH
MPILRKESEIYPPDLFSLPPELPWEIVQVRSRQEKALARLLTDRQQPFYLPQIARKVRRMGRSFTSFLPLFSGYVFIRRTNETRQTLWSSAAVARVIPVEDQPLLDAQLRQIRSLQEAGAVLLVRREIVAGDAVRILDGAFQGYEGMVVRERDVTRLVVSITALNKSVTAEFPRESIEPLVRAL